VVPNLAKREHLKNLPILFETLRKKYPHLDPDLITVTVGPGLEPALWTGIEFGKLLAERYGRPLVGANHLEGHLYSFLLPSRSSTAYASKLLPKKLFPAVALIVSGGHTLLLYVESFSKWKLLGETRDDAAGEAFDKVARLLDLPYPGGPEVEKLSAKGKFIYDNLPAPDARGKELRLQFFRSQNRRALLYPRSWAQTDPKRKGGYRRRI
jgi:N6-L-threonylcarbamoyladenine synthase